MGVHQKIDRVARKHLRVFLDDDNSFPSNQQILHFEGINGPDGIKRKSPAIDELWHFINPADPGDTNLLDIIDDHIENLARALRSGNQYRAAFEAAWMAHAITDGLTPPHHFPLEDILKELMNGEELESRDSVAKKAFIRSENGVETLKNNWRYWGAKGAMSSHIAFEAGVASAIPYKRFKSGLPTGADLELVASEGYREFYKKAAFDVYNMNLFNRYLETGWTTILALEITKELMPLIIRAVTLGWLAAVWEAEKDSA